MSDLKKALEEATTALDVVAAIGDQRGLSRATLRLLSSVAAHLLLPTDARVDALQTRCNELLLEVRAMRRAGQLAMGDDVWEENVEQARRRLREDRERG